MVTAAEALEIPMWDGRQFKRQLRVEFGETVSSFTVCTLYF